MRSFFLRTRTTASPLHTCPLTQRGGACVGPRGQTPPRLGEETVARVSRQRLGHLSYSRLRAGVRRKALSSPTLGLTPRSMRTPSGRPDASLKTTERRPQG